MKVTLQYDHANGIAPESGKHATRFSAKDFARILNIFKK